MAPSRNSVASIALSASLAAAGCGNSSKNPPSGQPSTGPCGAIDYAAYATAPAVHFRADVMPIFGLSCAATECHNDANRKAGLYLGVRCAYDSTTKQCAFPDQQVDAGGQSNPPAPLTDQIVNDVHASLMEDSKTAPAAKRVVPGDPEHSFVIQKCSDSQSDQGYQCTNQDSTHTGNPVPCGASMPLNNPALCEGSSRARFDTLAAWIAQGAKND